VEAAAFTLHLLGEVHCLLAHATLLPSSPVRHPAGKAQAETASGRGWGRAGQPERAPASCAPAAVPHLHTQRPPTDVCCLHRCAGLVISTISRTQDAHRTQRYSTQQYQLPPRDHWSCQPGAAEVPCAGSRGTSQLLSAPGQGRKQDSDGRQRLRRYPRHRHLVRSQPCYYPSTGQRSNGQSD